MEKEYDCGLMQICMVNLSGTWLKIYRFAEMKKVKWIKIGIVNDSPENKVLGNKSLTRNNEASTESLEE